jgi:hypothetical protein
VILRVISHNHLQESNTTTAVTGSIDPARLPEERLAQASPDLLRELLQAFFRDLVARSLTGVTPATCDAHSDLTQPRRRITPDTLRQRT